MGISQGVEVGTKMKKILFLPAPNDMVQLSQMTDIKQEIIDSLKKVLVELGVDGVEPQLEVPSDPKNGDYSTNIALQVFGDSRFKIKDLGIKNPLELAEKISTILKSYFINHKSLDRIEAIHPGFINFYLSKDTLLKTLLFLCHPELDSGSPASRQASSNVREIPGQARNDMGILDSKVGHTDPSLGSMHGKKVVVEFTDPNPFKEFHIGHLYSNTIGEALSRLIESTGAQVRRVNYQGDVGLHVAKALYGLPFVVIPDLIRDLERPFGEMLNQVQHDIIDSLEAKSLPERIKVLGEAYAFGSKVYEEDETAKKEINDINKKVYEKDSGIMDLYSKGRQWSLEYFETIYQRLGTKFDGYYYESEVAEGGIKTVSDHIKDGIFVASDGAVIFRGKNYGLHNRVFINSLGLPTYEAKELGLAFAKYQDYPYDLSIVITGNEINEYFRVLLHALSLIDPVLAEKTKHISHGMVRLPSGKMSSRTGTIISGEWLLDEAKKRISEAYKDMDQETAEQVAVGAVKYSLLKSGIGKDIEFGFEESIGFEGNSGPYLQYTYVRTQSVLQKAGEIEKIDLVSTNYDLENEEILLLRTLHQYQEIVDKSVHSFSPSILCGYLFQLAHQFNLFYAQHSILESDNKNFRLALTRVVGKVLKDGLHLLGIPTPTRM